MDIYDILLEFDDQANLIAEKLGFVKYNQSSLFEALATTAVKITQVNFNDDADFNTHKGINVVDPTSAQDIATKNYVDNLLVTDHGALTGLGDDDHSQYALLAGRSSGQTLIGGTASGNNLTLQSNPSRDGQVSIQALSGTALVADMTTSTGGGVGHIGLNSSVSGTLASSTHSLTGVKSSVVFTGTGSGVLGSGIGVRSTALLSGSVTAYYGNYTSALTSSGTIGTAYGSYISVSTSGGSITTGYGLYIVEVAGTTAYSIYDVSNKKCSFGGQIETRVTTGTAPLVVSSATAVTNLNADLLDGSHASAFGLVASPLSQFAATTSAQLAGVISDETGSGALVFASSPILVTPTLGVATATSLACPTFTTASGAMTFTPAAGSNFNVALSGSGELTSSGHITPTTTTTYNLGSGSKLWSSIYAANLYATNVIETLYLDSKSSADITVRTHVGASYITAMTISNATGNVGIGTTIPSYPLDVLTTVSNPMRLQGTSSNTSTALNAETGLILKNVNSTVGNMASISNRDSNNNSNAQINFVNVTQTGTGEIAFTTRNVSSGYAERMRIGSTGNVGIGITAPTALCHLGASTTSRASLCIPSGTAPTSPVEGDVWNDSSQNCDVKYRVGLKLYQSGVLYSSAVVGTSLTNSTTETTLIPTGIGTTTIPANFFKSGKLIKLTGTLRINAIVSGDLTLRFKIGAGTAATFTLTDVSALSIKFNQYYKCVGTGGSVLFSQSTELEEWDDFITDDVTGTLKKHIYHNGVNVNTTISNVLNITGQWSTASSSLSVLCDHLTIEVLS